MYVTKQYNHDNKDNTLNPSEAGLELMVWVNNHGTVGTFTILSIPYCLAPVTYDIHGWHS